MKSDSWNGGTLPLRIRTILACLALLAVTPSCNRPRFDSPKEAYLSFTRALQKGDVAVAYGVLSADTRKELERRAKDISDASGGAVPNNPTSLFVNISQRAPSVTEVKVLKEEGKTAVLSVSAGEKVQQVRMVKEEAGWKLDLAGGL
jgi:hypothetical protein